jgi:VWFA-related protein
MSAAAPARLPQTTLGRNLKEPTTPPEWPFSPPLVLRLGVAVLLAVGLCVPQAQLQAAAPQEPQPPEMRTEETAPGFSVKAQRNEVLVRVVVRDASGKAISNLTKDDFRLYDNGKPQAVSAFLTEGGSAAAVGGAAVVGGAATKAQAPVSELGPPSPIAQRYVAFYFDDLVISFEDMARTRDAAERYLESSLRPTDRVGIFTSSGGGSLDFTDDRAKLHEALFRLKPRLTLRPESDCPPLSPYEAYLIVELHDQQEIEIAGLKVIQCACGGDPSTCPDPRRQAEWRADSVWRDNETQSRQSLRVLTDLVRRLGSVPGQRSIVWVSPGFLALTLHQYLAELTERALRNRVVINALDARGLYAMVPGGDASEGTTIPLSPIPGLLQSGPEFAARLVSIQSTGQSMNDDVMAEIAHDTGGVFFHNNNDYDAGFRKAGALPEFAYLLGFSPRDLKLDGKYHKLKVELVAGRGYSVQARNGYYAPSAAPNAPQRVQEEIEQAVFSQDEFRELPLDISTQFFKVNDQTARLSVLARLDVRSLHFRKEEGRNVDNLTMIVAVFDRDGNLVDAKKKVIETHFRDATLEKLTRSGLGTKTGFEVRPGTYQVRVVLRESDSAQLSAQSRAVEIPY